MDRYSVVVVDDDQEDINILKDVLESTCLEVIASARSKEELNRLLDIVADIPDVMIVDFFFPQASAHEIVELVKGQERYNDTLIVVTTGVAYPEEMEHSKIDIILEKPHTYEELLASCQMIEEIVRKRKFRR